MEAPVTKAQRIVYLTRFERMKIYGTQKVSRVKQAAAAVRTRARSWWARVREWWWWRLRALKAKWARFKQRWRR